MLARLFHPEWASPTVLVNTAKFLKQFLLLDEVTSILRMLTGSDTQDLNVVGPLSHKCHKCHNILGGLYIKPLCTQHKLEGEGERRKC